MIITYILGISLIISLAINLAFAWYIRNLLRFLTFTTDNSRELLASLSEYETHLEKVYNLDLFYGDTTLENLLKHSKSITEEVHSFVATTDSVMTEEPHE